MAEKGFGVKEINLIGASGTPTIESPNNLNLNAVNVAISTNATIGGNLTVTGNIGIAGTLTYEDVTNVDAVGIITAREGVFIPDNKELKIGNTASSPDLKIYHNTSNTLIENSTGQLALSNSDGNISIKATDSNGDIIMRVGGSTSSENAIVAVHHGEVILSCNGATRLTTTSTGITVAGTAVATTFSGSGASLTNLPAANLTGTLPAISGANLTNLPASTPADTDVQITFDISASGSSGYIFTGPGNDGSTVNPDIYLVRGQRYRFINTTGSSHPFEFRNAANNADYTDGITGSQSGTQDFNVQYDAPAQLKYRCTIHTGSMQGNIYIVGQELLNGSNNRIVTASGAYGLNGESNLTFDGSNTLAITGPEGGAARIDLICDEGDDAADKVRLVHTSGNEFKIQRTTSHTDSLVITSNGKVNIGTGNLNQTDRMLNVYGGRMRIEGISSGNSFEIMNSASAGQSNGILCQAGTNSSDYNSTFRNTSGATLFRIRGDGNVLIGTTDATTIGTIASSLVVGSTTNNDEVALTLNVMEGANGRRVKFFLDDDDGVFGIDSTASSGVPPFVVRMATSEKLRIKSNGIIVAGNSGTPYGNALIQSFIAHGNTAGESGFSSVDTTSVAAGVGGEIAFHGKYNTGAQDYAYYGHIRGIKENATNGNTACALTFHTRPNATAPIERLRIDSNGNLSLGAQTNNSDIHSSYRCLQVYKSAYIWGYSSASYPAVHITNNARPTTSSFTGGWKRDLAGTYTAPVQLELYTGNFNVRTADDSTADSDISWATRFTVTQAGKIGINKSSPDVALHMTNDDASPYIRNENTGSNSSYTGFSIDLSDIFYSEF